ncbi:MAG: ATP-dependent helicase [Lentisphaerae bacterium]|nr:ATP-dependent helicase [Lentisphaerota bacterium]
MSNIPEYLSLPPTPDAEIVIRHPSCCFLIDSPPGTGKTEVLAMKAKHIFAAQSETVPKILTLSFKRHAANDLNNRIRQYTQIHDDSPADSFTFDGFAKELLDRFGQLLPEQWRPSPDYCIDTELFAPATVAEKLYLAAGHSFFMSDIETLPSRNFALECMVNEPLPEEMSFDGTPENDIPLLMWQYCLKQTPSVLDFPLICALAELLLRCNPQLAKALQCAYTHIFLDEFQDTTIAHYRLLKTAFPPGTLPVTAAGDQQQNIMLWAGAMHGIFFEFQHDYNAPKVLLPFNYRSNGTLLSIQNHLAKFMLGKDAKPPVLPAVVNSVGECRIMVFPDETAESRFVIDKICSLLQLPDISPRDIGIIVRQFPENVLNQLHPAARDRSIRIRNEEKTGKLLAEPVIKMLFDLWHMIFYPSPEIEAQERLMHFLSEPAGNYSTISPHDELDKFRSQILHDFGQLMFTPDDLTDLLEKSTNFLDKKRLKTIFSRYRQGKYLELCLAELAQQIAASALPCAGIGETVLEFSGNDFIPLTTVQQCKAMEYHTLFLINLDGQELWADDADPFQDLPKIYLASARARQNLYLTASRERNMHSQDMNNIRLLSDILAPAWVIPEIIS